MLPLASLPFPNINPVLIQIGPLAVHWYGIGYIVGILFAWWYAKRLAANQLLWLPAQSRPKPGTSTGSSSTRLKCIWPFTNQ